MDVDDDWEPNLTASGAGARWKWGYNGETDETTIWEVSGPGDGFPSHGAYLEAAWGRPARVAKGDALGVAESTSGSLHVHAYYGARVPESIVAGFRNLVPVGTPIEYGEPSEEHT